MRPAKLLEKSASLKAQFARYVVVGGLAFVADFAVLFVLTEYLQLHYLVSATFAFGLGSVVNYLLAVAWVFDHRAIGNRAAEITAYVSIGVVGLLLNNAVLWFLTEIGGLLYLHSKAWAAILIFGFNFGVRKLLLFSPRRISPSPTEREGASSPLAPLAGRGAGGEGKLSLAATSTPAPEISDDPKPE